MAMCLFHVGCTFKRKSAKMDIVDERLRNQPYNHTSEKEKGNEQSKQSKGI